MRIAMNGRQLFWKKSTLINYQFIMEVQWRTPMETQNVHPRLVFSINHVRSAGRNFPELFQWGKQVERVRWNTLMNTSFKEKWHYLFLTILRRCLLQFLGNVYFSPQLRTKSKCELANKKNTILWFCSSTWGDRFPNRTISHAINPFQLLIW